MPVVNNPIGSFQNTLTKHWLISPRPRQGTDKPDAYGESTVACNNPLGQTFESPTETRLLVSYGDSNVWPGGFLQATVGER